MSFNQRLREPRVLRILAPRMLALVVFCAAVLLVAGCRSAPADTVESAPVAAGPVDTAPAQTADDLTATEAAIAGFNDGPDTPAPAQTAQLIRPDAPQNYTVRRGDTLWDIAKRVYDKPTRYRQIYRANRHIVRRPGLIYPGQVLVLPGIAPRD